MKRGVAFVLALALGACATTPAPHPEATPFAQTADATSQLDAALARAALHDTRVLLVTGADWCHDSRALAGWLGTQRFAALVSEHYELVFVDVGQPQTGEGRNLDLARRFGHEQEGTPNLLVLTPEGLPVNAGTAASWRNAASRSEEAIHAELLELAQRPVLDASQ